MLEIPMPTGLMTPKLESICQDANIPDYIRWIAAKHLASEYTTNYEVFNTMSDLHLGELKAALNLAGEGSFGADCEDGSPEYKAFSNTILVMLMFARGEGLFFHDDGVTDAQQVVECYNRLIILAHLEALRRLGKVEINPSEFTILPSDDTAWIARATKTDGQ